jgi:hypothetical protein
MTLQQISEGIDQRASEWATPFKDLLRTVPDDPRVMHKIIAFAQHAVTHHFSELKRAPVIADFREAVAQASVASFRLGLLVGMKLDPPGLQHVSEIAESMHLSEMIGRELKECETCYGSGSICNTCGKSVNACNCSNGDRESFSPVTCLTCDGRGVVAT